jgi:hypothetical protein
VVATKRGGPDVLKIVKNEIREPFAGDVRIKVIATGVGRTDINYRYGLSPFAPKVPFMSGYEVVGLVDAEEQFIFYLFNHNSLLAKRQQAVVIKTETPEMITFQEFLCRKITWCGPDGG